jgi:hypothetical protein
MIFWSLCAFIWFKNMKKMLLQMTSGFLQLESTFCIERSIEFVIKVGAGTEAVGFLNRYTYLCIN